MTRTNAQAPPGAPGGEPWTTRRLLAWMSEAFTKADLEAPRLQAEMLLAHVLGCPRLKLFTEPERRASEQERQVLRSLVGRALRHEPIDYLVGERSFFGMMFRVDARVLVPRPATETAVEFVLQEARRAMQIADGVGTAEDAVGEEEAGRDIVPGSGRRPGPPGERVFSVEEGAATLSAFKPTEDDLDEDDESELDKPVMKRAAPAPPSRGTAPAGLGTPVAKRARSGGPPWRIADVGTGSGCIAIALAKNLARATVIATDLSTDALDLAIENARRHGVFERIEFRHGDLLVPLEGDVFDVVVSNPPYIPDDEWDAVPANVKDHEPEMALRGGADGLDLIRPLFAGVGAVLRPGGWVVVETATSRAAAAEDLARAAGLSGVRVLKDLEGLDRVVVGRAR